MLLANLMEKRQFTRILFEAPAQFDLGDIHYEITLIDISLKGALIKEPEDFQGKNGDNANITLTLTDGESNIRMEGKIAHVSNNCVGIKCHHIDLESATHLRRLVELNIGDQELLNRELAALINYH